MNSTDPYLPPQSQVSDQPDTRLGWIGVRWGLLFASPFMAALLYFGIALLRSPLLRAMLVRSYQFLATPVILSVASLIIPSCGRWWGVHGFRKQNRDFLSAAFIQGLMLTLSMFCSSGFFLWRYTHRMPPLMLNAGPLLIRTGLYTLLFLALGATVRWRVRKAEALAWPAASPDPSFKMDPVGGGRPG